MTSDIAVLLFPLHPSLAFKGRLDNFHCHHRSGKPEHSCGSTDFWVLLSNWKIGGTVAPHCCVPTRGRTLCTVQEPPAPRRGQHLPAPPLPTPLWRVELLRLAPLPRRSSLLPVGSAGALHLVEEKRSLLCHVNAPCSHGLVPAFPHHQLASVPHILVWLSSRCLGPTCRQLLAHISLPTSSARGSVAPAFCSHCPH